MRRKVPGLFVFCNAPLAKYGKRACLRSMLVRVRIPGGVPEFLRRPQAFACSFTTWMWQRRPAARERARQTPRTVRGGAGRAFARCKENSSRCSAAGQRASFGTRRPQVRILPARPDDSPVAQRNEERAATTREDEGSNPSGGANHGRRNSGEQSACLSSRTTRVQIPPAPPYFGSVHASQI